LPAVRLAWLTDVHLNFLSPRDVDRLCAEVAGAGVDAVCISGDISHAPDLERDLQRLAAIGPPVYFVLGNHDFYHSHVAEVRVRVAALCARTPGLVWLGGAGAVALTPATALVGHDGWADGRAGDWEGSRILLNDYRLIGDLAGRPKAARLEALKALGDEAAAHFRAVVPAALARARRVIAVSHPPPFPEACRYLGFVTSDRWLPHLACVAAGEALHEAMAARPDREMTVLCGHTHHASKARMLPNLLVLTGRAEYGVPRIERIIDVE
jgi:3',5'-cyclic AMP phosphodiesterase CpdA